MCGTYGEVAMEFMNGCHYHGHLIKSVVIVEIFSSRNTVRSNGFCKGKDTIVHHLSNVLK